jgi:hypothetical protein
LTVIPNEACPDSDDTPPDKGGSDGVVRSIPFHRHNPGYFEENVRDEKEGRDVTELITGETDIRIEAKWAGIT